MRPVLAALLFWLAVAPPVLAGAWLRDQGRGFNAFAATLRNIADVPEAETRLYAEYGLLRRLTVGIDINERAGLSDHALAFARLPLRDTSGPWQLALELGAGAHHRGARWAGMLKTTLLLGRGFQSGWGAGWLETSAAIEHRLGMGSLLYKLDATVGLSSGGRLRPMLRIETAYASGTAPSWAIKPALMFDTRTGATWVFGLEKTAAPNGGLGLELALWRRF